MLILIEYYLNILNGGSSLLGPYYVVTLLLPCWCCFWAVVGRLKHWILGDVLGGWWLAVTAGCKEEYEWEVPALRFWWGCAQRYPLLPFCSLLHALPRFSLLAWGSLRAPFRAHSCLSGGLPHPASLSQTLPQKDHLCLLRMAAKEQCSHRCPLDDALINLRSYESKTVF